MARERMTKAEMVAEFLREVGALIIVFGFIDLVIPEKISGATKISPWAVVAISALFFVSGVTLERMRGE